MSEPEIVKVEDTEVIDASGEVISGQFEVKLSKAYNFDGSKIEKINLNGMQEITAADMIRINRRMSRNGNVDFMQEITTEYALEVAARAAEMPIEFFQSLSMKDTMKIKGAVMGFIWG